MFILQSDSIRLEDDQPHLIELSHSFLESLLAHAEGLVDFLCVTLVVERGEAIVLADVFQQCFCKICIIRCFKLKSLKFRK